MSELSVCHYAIATHLGGGERSLLELVRGMKETRYRPWVLLPSHEGPLCAELGKSGVETVVLEMPESFFKISRSAPLQTTFMGIRSAPGMVQYFARLMELMKAKSPALIHSNAIKCHALSAVLGPMMKIPVLWHMRDILPAGPTLWTLRGLLNAPGIYLVGNSAATAEPFGGRSEKVSVVHNGLDPAAYRHEPHSAFRDEYGIGAGIPLVGILGVLARWKGQSEFLRMAKALIDRGSPAHFLVIGGEIYDTVGESGVLRSLQKEASDLGISRRVHFTGFRSNPAHAINGLDIVVHASIRPEPFGRVIIEAMACEVPVVAARDGGVVEIVEDGESGLLFQPADVEGMAGCVERILGDSALRARLVSGGRKRFLEKFTREKYVAGVAEVYDGILEVSKLVP